MMDIIISRLTEIFSLEYVFTVILTSYLIISGIDVINKEKKVPTWVKRFVTFAVGATSFFVFRHFTGVTTESLIASYLLAVFVYDTAIKTILTKLNITYKK